MSSQSCFKSQKSMFECRSRAISYNMATVSQYYDHPAFYLSEQSLCDDLATLFADSVQKWGEMSDDELNEWLSLYDPSEGIPYAEWNDED